LRILEKLVSLETDDRRGWKPILMILPTKDENLSKNEF
jgi:hypothetical protein